jgi:hypothetical protein
VASSTPPQPGQRTFQVSSNQPEPRSVRETGDRLFLAQPVSAGKAQDIDTAQLPVGAVADHRFNRRDDALIGRTAQGVEKRLGFVHGGRVRQNQKTKSENLEAENCGKPGGA